MKQQLPGSTASLVCGILSICLCFIYGIPGLVLGIIGLVMSKKAITIHAANPSMYDGIANAKAGRVLSIIGTSLSGLYVFLMLIGLLFISSMLEALTLL
jgi:hypothetical protein